MYLLDTDTLIYFLKGNEAVIGSFKAHMDTPKAISVTRHVNRLFCECRQ